MTETGSQPSTLDAYLDEILCNPGRDMGPDPGLWGSREAYELQALQLLELRFFPFDRAGLMTAFFLFMHRRHPDLGNRPLFALGLPVNEIAAALRAFRQELVSRR